MTSLVREFIDAHGADAFARKEDAVLSWMNRAAGMSGNATTTVWEDVRADGASGGAWFEWKQRVGA
jgi:hypothetical protein|eukprot:SAG25_NODE_849_length_5079_cov_19.384739_7_plen_66_part_00